MAPFVPEEVDVFTVPHSRMKALVNAYVEMIQTTNFTNEVDVELLLESLFSTFLEFKTHEQIENRFIMCRLKNKLKKLSISNSAVCNCHQDSHLLDMIRLVQAGRNKKTDQDRINYGLQLKKALEEFTRDFLPHMKQEEEVFQPMLLKYFSYDELCEIKRSVIQQHLLRKQVQTLGLEKSVWDLVRGHDSGNSCGSDEDETETTEHSSKECISQGYSSTTLKPLKGARFEDLPPEVLLKVFSLLNPLELGQCSQVCSSWNEMAFDPSLWTSLYPVMWAKDKWGFDAAAAAAAQVDEDDQDDGFVDEEDYVVIDDDADIDESECHQDTDDEEDRNDVIKQLRSEAMVLLGLTKYVLPRVGDAVKVLDLSHCRAITNGLLQKMIKLCPNIEHLDLTQTRVSDLGLKSIGKSCGSHLKHLTLSGCENISDATLVRLAMALSQPAIIEKRYTFGRQCRASSPDNMSTTGHECLCEEYYHTRRQLQQHCDKPCGGQKWQQYGSHIRSREVTGSGTCTCTSGKACPKWDKNHSPQHKVNNFAALAFVSREDWNNLPLNLTEGAVRTGEDDGTGRVRLPCGVIKDEDDGPTGRVRLPCGILKGRDETIEECSLQSIGPKPYSSRMLQQPQMFAPCNGCPNRKENLRCNTSQNNGSLLEGWSGPACCCQRRGDARHSNTQCNGCNNKDDDVDNIHEEQNVNCTVIQSENCNRQSPQKSDPTEKDNPSSNCAGKAGPPDDACNVCQSVNFPVRAAEVLTQNSYNSSELPVGAPMVRCQQSTVVVKCSCCSDLLLCNCSNTTDVRAHSRNSSQLQCTSDFNSSCNRICYCNHEMNAKTERSLEYLDLSGCYLLTDTGIRALAGCGPFPRLKVLDVSGCLNITGSALSELVSVCANINPADLFYCDNIEDGPYADCASGCQNVGSKNRVCCRAGYQN